MKIQIRKGEMNEARLVCFYGLKIPLGLSCQQSLSPHGLLGLSWPAWTLKLDATGVLRQMLSLATGRMGPQNASQVLLPLAWSSWLTSVFTYDQGHMALTWPYYRDPGFSFSKSHST